MGGDSAVALGVASTLHTTGTWTAVVLPVVFGLSVAWLLRRRGAVVPGETTTDWFFGAWDSTDDGAGEEPVAPVIARVPEPAVLEPALVPVQRATPAASAPKEPDLVTTAAVPVVRRVDRRDYPAKKQSSGRSRATAKKARKRR